MDPRLRRHAEILADATDVATGDHVVVSAPTAAEPLVVALYGVCGERNARPTWLAGSSAANRARIRASDPGEFGVSEHALGLVESSDAAISIKAPTNTAEMSDVEPERMGQYAVSQRPVSEALMELTWTVTKYPTPAAAQKAGMSTAGYEDFVFSAVNKDWAAQAAFQAQMVDRLNDAGEVRIVAGETTDVTMSVEGMVAENDTCTNNVPGGEVFTAPVPDSVEGHVTFDHPVVFQGRDIVNARLKFEDGEVVDYSADRNEATLGTALDRDAGSRRIGELGIGMNRDIDRFTYDMLFDEKMGDTIHLALGRAYEENVPDDMERNESDLHLDMLVDLSEDARIEFDGEVVQRDGVFCFEDGFQE